MKTVKEKIAEIIKFQDKAHERGYQLMTARGCEWKMYSTPDDTTFEDDGVLMRFRENTRHDCPDYESIKLSIEELEKSDKEWKLYIESVQADTSNLIKEQTERDEIERKERLYKDLKSELGH